MNGCAPREALVEKTIAAAPAVAGEASAIFSAGVEAATAGGAMALAAGYEFDRHTRILDIVSLVVAEK